MALNFDGSTERIEYTVNADLNNLTQITVYACAKFDTLATFADIITHWNYGADDKSFTLAKHSNGSFRWFWEVAYNDTGLTDYIAITDGTLAAAADVWYIIIGRWRTTAIEIDVARLDTGATANNSSGISRTSISDVPNSVELDIGSQDDASNYLDGKVACAAIWDVSLSNDEVQALLNRAHPFRFRYGNLKFIADFWEGNEQDYGPAKYAASITGTPNNVDHAGLSLPTVPGAWLDLGIAAGQSVAVGQVTESEVAQAMTSAKQKAINLISETDSSQAVSAIKAATLGLSLETDLAQPLAGSAKTKALGLNAETELAQSINRLKSRALGLSTETNAAQTFATAAKTKAVGLVSESDLAQVLGRAKLKTLGLNSESNLAQPITSGGYVVAVGLVSETDQVQGISWSPKHRLVAQVTESELAQAIGAAKLAAVGLTSETDLAQAISASTASIIGQVAETDLAQALTKLKMKALTSVTEVDLAQAIAPNKAILIVQLLESDLSSALGKLKHKLVGLTAETDAALPITLAGAVVIQVIRIRAGSEAMKTPGLSDESMSAPELTGETMEN